MSSLDRVIINNVPSSNRKDFGFRAINSSESHNLNQEEMLNDILDLFNKTNSIERFVTENADFIKAESTFIESKYKVLNDKFARLLDKYNELVQGKSSRKVIILPEDCKVSSIVNGAKINPSTCDIKVLPFRSVSKLAIFDSVTDSMYIPDSLNVDIRSQTTNTITETDNDIYAPFYNDNQMYWTRKVVTDNSVDEVVTEYVITLAEEIMTTEEMNEIVIHPFMCNVVDVFVRFGDSNRWERIESSKYHKAVQYGKDDFETTPRPFSLNFENKMVNQMKIVVSAKNYIEGETNLRNFRFGLKRIEAYEHYYDDYLSSCFDTSLEVVSDGEVLVEGLTFHFNNDVDNSKFLSDIDYEFFYKDENGRRQKVFEEFPFVLPSKDLYIKFRIGEKYKHMNIRSIDLNYKVIKSDFKLLVSYIHDLRVDFKDDFNIYYYAKPSNSNSLMEAINHEISLDNGATWTSISPIFDGTRYVYKHKALGEVCKKTDCFIRITDFSGRIGLSNKFTINAEMLDKPPVMDPIDNKIVKVNKPFKLRYIAGDDFKITSHEISEDNGQSWKVIIPTIEEWDIRGIKYFKFTLDMMYDSIGDRNCLIRIRDGENKPTVSNPFTIRVEPILVEDITISKDSVIANKGEQVQLKAVVLPLDASDKTLHWESTNNDIAVVNSLGLIDCVDKGACEVFVMSNDRKHRATCKVVVNVPVSKVILNESEKVLNVGSSFTLVESVLPNDAGNKNVTWSASNDCITLKNGVVTAVKAGVCIVTVQTVEGGHEARCIIEVRVPVKDMQLNKSQVDLFVGDRTTISATILPTVAYNKNVKWESLDVSIADVIDGTITAKGKGTTKIAATTEDGGIKRYCTVNTKVAIGDLELDYNKLDMNVGDVEVLNATVLPVDAYDKSLVWISSNVEVVVVTQEGQLKAVGVGESIITARAKDGREKQCTVKVSEFKKSEDPYKDPQIGKIEKFEDPYKDPQIGKVEKFEDPHKDPQIGKIEKFEDPYTDNKIGKKN